MLAIKILTTIRAEIGSQVIVSEMVCVKTVIMML